MALGRFNAPRHPPVKTPLINSILNRYFFFWGIGVEAEPPYIRLWYNITFIIIYLCRTKKIEARSVQETIQIRGIILITHLNAIRTRLDVPDVYLDKGYSHKNRINTVSHVQVTTFGFVHRKTLIS